MRSKRINDIENYIIENRTVTLDQLCKVFQVSKNTIRRDLKEIIAEGNIKKIYGGVTVKTNKELLPFSERNISNLEAKKKIACKASELIEDGDVIFIDSGTTTCHMMEYLKEKKNLTIITNNLEIIIRAIPHENIKIISLSGELDRETLSFTGDSATAVLNNYNISKAFMASAGVSVEGGITNSSTKEYEIKCMAVRRSRDVYLLVSREKFNHIAIMTYCGMDRLSAIVCDYTPPVEIREFSDENEIDIIIAE
ncbi:DeoR/GlpR family DNA-binding transcription regulator [Sinanaerobacter chloroacetimidivorans]|jgi:DeoR family myo-inositol catabolism operon transcriptional repressor|uniref:DeoR/GlpR transcriptional regulator n=1 Tax=Sinanaerobacter chloroacetimidivorans TaxID=2818044 RepID=A0A8J7W810_9FIRM|nr:DeoR/GlpR family DNA-binding transcription regulator [Sinanaerobacter chloroacetimidivorans]MBR0600560.1 DeoR/GlpR transcriptional regulator [Sinanaerobacter chloroacetimidivorans]